MTMLRANLTDTLNERNWDLAALFEETKEINLLIGRIGSGCPISLGEGFSGEVQQRRTQKQQVNMLRTLVDKIRGVSAKHAKIRYGRGLEGWGYYIIDSLSTNGTFLGDKPVLNWTRLENGTELYFGAPVPHGYGPVVFSEEKV